MHFQIRFTTPQQTAVDQEMLKNILAGQLERFQHRVKQVQLYIEDVNGPRGGLDKHCRCVVHLRRTAPIVIRDCDESIHAMIHRVADRASHALGRHLEKRIDSRSNRRRNPLSDSTDLS